MADLFLNFKDFNHHSSDDNSTTLQHKKLGHKLVLAHNALSDKHRKALKEFSTAAKMADGGKAPMPSQTTQPATDQKSRISEASSGSQQGGVPSDSPLKTGQWNIWAEGGQVKKPEETLNYKDLMQQKKAMNSAEANKPVMPKRKMAEGGEIDKASPVAGININPKEPGYTKMAEGGMPAAADPSGAGLPCLNPHCKSHGRPHPNCRCYGPGGPAAEEHAEGGEVGQGTKYCAYGFPHHANCEYAKGASVQGKDVRHGMQAKEDGRTEDYEMSKDFARKEAKGRAAEERHVKPNIKGLAEGGSVQRYAMGGLHDPEAYIEDRPLSDQPESQNSAPKQVVSTDMPEEQVTANKPQLFQNQTYQPTHTPQQTDTPTPETQSLAQQELLEDHKYAADANAGHITPKTYNSLWHDQSVPGKISTLFGMLAGGMGSGLTGQPSAIMQMMDKTIQNDLEAQKVSAQNKQTHWNMNYQHALQTAQANGMDANADYTRQQAASQADGRTHMQQNRNAWQHIVDNVKSMPDSPKKIQYLQAAATAGQAIDAQNANIADQMEMRNTLLNDKFGAPMTSTIHNPHPSVIQPGGPANPNKPKQSAENTKELPVDYGHTLSPGADKEFTKLQYDPRYKEQLGTIAEQKGKAELADKAIDTIKNTFPKLYNETGGAMGYLRRQGHNLESIPYIGTGVNAATNYITDTNKNAAYDTDYNNLIGAVRGALQGNVSEDLLNQLVRDSRPETNDPPELRQKKAQNMVDFIRSHMKTDMLPPKLTNKRK